jgi:transposase-like protein
MKTTVDEIRAALVRSNEGIGRPYPTHVRRAVLAHVARQRRAGVSLETCAAEIGMSATTLRKWKREGAGLAAEHAPAFCEVEIVEPRAPASALVVHGPAGLRIEGATMADIADLFRRLA